jgi:peptidoglycan hydrolase CwlO-like protein
MPENTELEVPQPTTVNSIDEYLEKREDFTSQIMELDEQVQDLYKDIDKYNEEGAPLGIKLNRISSVRRMFLDKIPFLTLYGVCLADPSDTSSGSNKDRLDTEVQVKKFFTRRNMIDLDTLKQAMDYIIEGRQLMKRGIALDMETTRLRIMDNDLDIAGNELLTKMYVPEDGMLSADEAIAGINEDFPKSDIKMWADSLMNDFRLDASDSVYSIRELNDRLLALFEKRKMLNEKIHEYNDQVEDFNDEVEDYNKDKDELLSQILKNNQEISEMQIYADSLVKNRNKSCDGKRKVWQFYRDLNYTKKDAWDYYKKSIESDEHGIQLLKKKNEIDTQKDQLSREQEKLNKLEEIYKTYQNELLKDIQQ